MGVRHPRWRHAGHRDRDVGMTDKRRNDAPHGPQDGAGMELPPEIQAGAALRDPANRVALGAPL